MGTVLTSVWGQAGLVLLIATGAFLLGCVATAAVFHSAIYRQPWLFVAMLLLTFVSGAFCVWLGGFYRPRPKIQVYHANRPGSGKSVLAAEAFAPSAEVEAGYKRRQAEESFERFWPWPKFTAPIHPAHVVPHIEGLAEALEAEAAAPSNLVPIYPEGSVCKLAFSGETEEQKAHKRIDLGGVEIVVAPAGTLPESVRGIVFVRKEPAAIFKKDGIYFPKSEKEGA